MHTRRAATSDARVTTPAPIPANQPPHGTLSSAAASFPPARTGPGIDPSTPAFWPAVLAAAAANRRARIILEGSTAEAVARIDARTTQIQVRVNPEVLAACRSSLAELEQIASTVAGHSIKLVPITDAPAAQPEAEAPKTSINEHPLVKSAIDLFKARVLSVQPRQPAEK